MMIGSWYGIASRVSLPNISVFLAGFALHVGWHVFVKNAVKQTRLDRREVFDRVLFTGHCKRSVTREIELRWRLPGLAKPGIELVPRGGDRLEFHIGKTVTAVI